MSSSRGSTFDDVEDWLDIGDNGSAPSLSLDDVLNEVENLDEGLSFTEDTIPDGDTPSISLFCDSPSMPSDVLPMGYQLDSAVVVHSHQSISHQIVSVRAKSGTAVAIAERNGRIAVATSRGHILIFDLDGRLDRYHQGDESTGSASCLTFSQDGKHLAVGFSKGALKILSVRTGTVHHLIQEAAQPGMGVLQIVYLAGSSSLLTLDNGGSVYEIRFKTKLTGRKDHSMRCIFSGCNGEVVNMRIMPNSMLALMTVSKLLLVSTRFGGSVLGAFSLHHSFQSPPLFSYWLGIASKSDKIQQSSSPLKALSSKSLRDFRICVSRGQKMLIFRLHVANFSTKHKSVTFQLKISLPTCLVNLHWISTNMIVGIDAHGAVWQIDTVKGNVKKATVDELEIVFATSDFKGLATGGRVSEAMRCMAELACFQSITNATSTSDRLICLAHDGLKIIEKVTEWEQLESFKERGDNISAALYLLDVVREKVCSSETFKKEAPNLLKESMRMLLEVTTNGMKEGKVAQLMTHYKKYIRILLHISISSKMLDFVYDELWSRLSLDTISRNILLELLDDYVLDGALIDPPPTIVSEYLQNLAAEGHFSQFQAAVVRFPIHTIDLHTVMSTCRQNGLYDGIIYVMNNALNDYISPLEEMLEAVRLFASREVLSDNEIDVGNRLLVYLNCCLTGRAYPFGMLETEQAERVPLEVYRCICSLKGKDGSSSEENYPYLRLLLQFDPQQFVHVICTCADASLFQTDGRLQRITDTIGLLCVSLRQESPLVHFLLLVSQLSERSLIVPPVELVQDAIISLLRIATWQLGSTENAVITSLKVVGQLDRLVILRAAQSPMRPPICSFLYLSERRFIDLVKCYIDANDKEVFVAIDQILRAGELDAEELNKFTNYIRSILKTLTKIDDWQGACLIIDHFADYLKTLMKNDEVGRKESFPILSAIVAIRRDRKQNTISADEDIDEHLFGILFEGLCKGWPRSPHHPSTSSYFSETIDGNENITPPRECLDDITHDLLLFWLPIGSRSDFCLNQAVATEQCTRSVVLLLEARGHIERAFEVLFEQLEKFGGFDDEQTVHWLDESLSFCSRYSSSVQTNEWLLRIFRFVASQIGQQPTDEAKHQINRKLQSLCTRIIETGTEHAGQLVESLLECPNFANSTYKECAGLIDEILGSCDYERKLLTNVLRVLNYETAEFNQEMYSKIGRRCEITSNSECITCNQTLNKSAYVFRCGHFQHIECATSSDKICPCEYELRNKSPLNTSRHIEQVKLTKHNIFADWDIPLNLLPSDSV